MAIIGISGKIGSGKDLVGKLIQYIMFQGSLKPVGWDFESWLKADEKSRANFSGWEVKKFAAKLKQVCSMLTGIPVVDFEKEEVKNSLLPDQWSSFFNVYTDVDIKFSNPAEVVRRMTVREFLQKVGTEAMRNNVHSNTWVNALFADYRGRGFLKAPEYGTMKEKSESPDWIEKDFPNWIITDMRFPNELEAVKAKGGLLLRIERQKFWWKRRNGEVFYTFTPFETEKWVESWEAPAEHLSETALDNNLGFHKTIINCGTVQDLETKVYDFLVETGVINLSERHNGIE